MNQIEHLIQNASVIETRLGYSFKDRSLLVLAFVHRSFINENREITQHNERLEFLGDAVLGMLISDYLYRYLPTTPEGQLSYLRSRLVEASSCVSYIQTLNIASFILLGKGERMNDGRGRESILADLFEAIIGAIYLDGGIEAAKQFIFANFTKQIEAILATPLRNWKALLQDYCQKKYQQTPVYNVLQESGPDHSKVFQISVLINQQELGRGTGASKKEAQQAAAADALSRFNLPEIFS
ncbi:ribonuclease III [Candidatus Protochlamydia phocaeensis]|uniref:ribonuclease III n=1 Tax=Candidatus Protochlamydia phocaeensis TaxID=1414722 RepID=UPI00083814D7|nr:ribonuclease III [Candidatus Protochlamydia phocaeensis]